MNSETDRQSENNQTTAYLGRGNDMQHRVKWSLVDAELTLPGLLTYWPSVFKALAVNRFGHSTTVC